MTKNLVIVESPAKAKTIKKYLGGDFQVLASYGHVRDLKPKKGAVLPEENFAMNYELIAKNAKHVDAIVKAVEQADTIYLATDPDREGEAISWHLSEILKQKRKLKGKPIRRVVFYEITKSAVNQAVANPRDLSMDLVNAQQARRALDYLVGFNLSPLLWKKVRRGLSAGRVQSPALRMIVEREEEIEAFKTQEYWSIEADLNAKNQDFLAKLVEWQNEKLQQFTINNGPQAESVRQELLTRANGQLTVSNVEKKQRKRNPAAPFTTSTLQQEAARKLGFTTKRTMQTAQQLYEGIDIGEGAVGLITYMRTDSVNLSNDAINEIRAYVAQQYGEKDLPEAPRMYKTKSKNAQEAHEAIRPTAVAREPELVKAHLSPDQLKLYTLIWKRAVACQMQHATIDTVTVDFACGDARLRSTGSTISNPGFIRVYQESYDDKPGEDEVEGGLLPALQVGDVVKLLNIRAEQHFTEPPPRYSEASLVKALEEYGIGRPSTYASIISTLQAREYVSLENKRFKPSDVARIVNKFLTGHFTKYVDYDFTAKLEDELDAVSRGEQQWIPLLENFWKPFVNQITTIEQTVSRSDVTQEAIDEKCPTCGKPLAIRLGKRGRFIGCTGFPECDYTRQLNETAQEAEQVKAEAEVVADRSCPSCGSPLHVKLGRYGRFIGCSNYPKCKHMEPLEKPKDTGVGCPLCKQGQLIARKSRYGKLFYSCNRYPDCQYAVWNPPLNETCPKCQWPVLTVKTTKRKGTEKVCPQKDCGYSTPAPELGESDEATE